MKFLRFDNTYIRVLLKTNKFQHTISYVADNHYLYIVKSIKNETIQTI